MNKSVSFGNDPGEYLLFNQRIIEGLYAQDLDLQSVDQVFGHIFSRLPDEVTVYPSENYYYFVLYADQRQFWGNMRLPSGQREDGLLSFAYFEFDEFPVGQRTGLTRSKFYDAEDGVIVREISRFVWEVSYEGKSVIFNLHELRQDRPTSFPLAPDESSIERTFDESGIQFFLLFNRTDNYFFWTLNEEEIVGDTLLPFEDEPDFLIGKKSGFVFWIDRDHGNRKILAAIRRLSVNRNDYYDGPFDQLADNYALESNVSEYMQRAFPGLRNRIDEFGYYLDRDRPLRVAISTYYTYLSTLDLSQFIDRLKASDDPTALISRGGAPVRSTTAPTPTPIPTPPPTS